MRGQSADLLVKLGDFLLLGFLFLGLRVLALEDNSKFGDGFRLPRGHWVGMEPMLGGNLGDGIGFFGCFQNDLGLEGGTVLFSHGR